MNAATKIHDTMNMTLISRKTPRLIFCKYFLVQLAYLIIAFLFKNVPQKLEFYA